MHVETFQFIKNFFFMANYSQKAIEIFISRVYKLSFSKVLSFDWLGGVPCPGAFGGAVLQFSEVALRGKPLEIAL